MKFRKGDVVVIAGDKDGNKLFQHAPKKHWPTILGYIGIVHYANVDCGIVGIITQHPFEGTTKVYYYYKKSNLTKIDHIPKRDWSGLDLPGFWS